MFDRIKKEEFPINFSTFQRRRSMEIDNDVVVFTLITRVFYSGDRLDVQERRNERDL